MQSAGTMRCYDHCDLTPARRMPKISAFRRRRPPIELGMEFRVRPTVPDDLEEPFRIETHPLVQAQQYPLGAMNSVKRWHWALFEGGYAAFGLTFTSGTILVDDRIAGRVIRIFRWHRRRIRAKYGWNLEPAFWGRGIMPAILTQDFTAAFADPRLAEIQADCFRDNPRCLRVLQKLGCEAIAVGPLERFATMLQSRCYRWIVRHRMTRAMWDAKRAAVSVEATRT